MTERTSNSPTWRWARKPTPVRGVDARAADPSQRQPWSARLLHKRIAAKGIYRDPVGSSDSHVVKASGLRWMRLMLLAPIPWAGRIWALPFLTALMPSERACREQGRRHKPLLDIGRQLALQARRWLPAAISLWCATAASPPCRSSTRCAAPASRRSPACGSTQH